MHRPKNRRRYGLTAGFTLLIVLTSTALGCGAVQGSEPERRENGAPGEDPTGLLLRQVQNGLHDSQVLEVRVGLPPDADFEPQGAPWLYIKVAASDQNDYVRGYWQALVVTGLVRDVAHGRGLFDLLGKTVTIVYPDGHEMRLASTVIDQPFIHPIVDAAPTATEQAVRRAAGETGAKVSTIRFSRPLGRVGPEIMLTTGDPRAFLAHRARRLGAIRRAAIGTSVDPRAEGAFIHVRDQAGKLVTVTAYSVRTGEGVGYTNPDFLDETPGFLGLMPRPEREN